MNLVASRLVAKHGSPWQQSPGGSDGCHWTVPGCSAGWAIALRIIEVNSKRGPVSRKLRQRLIALEKGKSA